MSDDTRRPLPGEVYCHDCRRMVGAEYDPTELAEFGEADVVCDECGGQIVDDGSGQPFTYDGGAW